LGSRLQISLREVIAETGPVTERLRVREIGDDEGRRLVRIIRRGRLNIDRAPCDECVAVVEWTLFLP
jgi:hypothetical protein